MYLCQRRRGEIRWRTNSERDGAAAAAAAEAWTFQDRPVALLLLDLGRRFVRLLAQRRRLREQVVRRERAGMEGGGAMFSVLESS